MSTTRLLAIWKPTAPGSRLGAQHRRLELRILVRARYALREAVGGSGRSAMLRKGAPVTLADVGEFGAISAIVDLLGSPPPPAGPGDDAALVPVSNGWMLASTDVLVEGVHFRLDWSTPEQVGRKAAAANLADVAAMGGTGVALLVALVAPATTPLAVLEGLSRGLRDEAAVVGASVVGGDLSEGPCLVISVTALGDLAGQLPVTRAGARPGDTLVLAGFTGRSAAGLRLLAAQGRPGLVADALRAAHRAPSPPYLAGPALAAAGARAMCDVSDGLLADAGHLAAASGVALELDRLPLAAGVLPEEALTGGEDHALLAALPPGVRVPPSVHAIGRVREGAGVRLGPTLAALAPLAAGGYRHFGTGSGRGSALAGNLAGK